MKKKRIENREKEQEKGREERGGNEKERGRLPAVRRVVAGGQVVGVSRLGLPQ